MFGCRKLISLKWGEISIEFLNYLNVTKIKANYSVGKFIMRLFEPALQQKSFSIKKSLHTFLNTFKVIFSKKSKMNHIKRVFLLKKVSPIFPSKHL
jgi:hypothetical protein